MTCVRREAGAHRPAASTPSRSPSSRPTPTGDGCRPDPRGGRARLSLVLPVLALLPGALGLFAAAPAQAQTTTVWSANLTVDHKDGYFGCINRFVGMGACSASTVLTDEDFRYRGRTYTIDGLYIRRNQSWDSPNRLVLSLSGVTIKTALAGMTLIVSGRDYPFAISDAVVGHPGLSTAVISWAYNPSAANPPSRWADGDTVSVRLVAPAIRPARPTGLSATAGDGEVSLSWTNPGDAGILKYQIMQGWGTVWGNWTDIPNSTPGMANATSYTVDDLGNGASYRFRIRAVNAAGNSLPSDTVRATPSAPATIPVGNTGTGTTVWSADLTVGEAGNTYFGCDDTYAPLRNCSAALTDNDIAYGGATYTVNGLYWIPVAIGWSSVSRMLMPLRPRPPSPG